MELCISLLAAVAWILTARAPAAWHQDQAVCEAILPMAEASNFAGGNAATLRAAEGPAGAVGCYYSFQSASGTRAKPARIAFDVITSQSLEQTTGEPISALTGTQIIDQAWKATQNNCAACRPVMGIGDEAFVVNEEDGGVIQFRKEYRLIRVMIFGLPAAADRAVKVAELIQDRISK
jgi:hypothetical protein